MVSAIVLANTNIGEEAQVLEKIKHVEGVEEAYALWGVYDLMVKVRAGSTGHLKEIVRSNLQRTGVTTLLTLMTAENAYRKPET